MLRSLKVINYALIRQLDLRFDQGLTVITGETGSGKSILLGALGLIIGKRADASVIDDTKQKCIVEAEFDVESYGLASEFGKMDLDYADRSIFRREILPSGRSRAFVNDTPVSLQQLKQLGEKLVDIHSQHDVLQLRDGGLQRQALDAVAGNSKVLAQYQKVYADWSKVKKSIADLEEKISKSNLDKDYILFQINELDEVNLKIGEQEKLEDEQKVAEHAEEIQLVLQNSNDIISEERGLLDLINSLESQLDRIVGKNEKYAEIKDRVKSLKIELLDIGETIEDEQSHVNIEPQRLQQITARLDELYRLQTKHSKQSVEELLELKDHLNGQISTAEDLQKDLKKLRAQEEEAKQKLSQLAQKLHESRSKTAPKLEKSVSKVLSELAMPKARLSVTINSQDSFNAYGSDDIQYTFAANEGSSLKPLGKVASGGELSRLMLAIKSLLADRVDLPVIIFDEIDTGISGKIAHKVGAMMLDMGQHRQVMAITHQAQVASQGEYHYKVWKSSDGKITNTMVKQLNAEERVNEIAEMISGEKLSDQAVATAIELLG